MKLKYKILIDICLQTTKVILVKTNLDSWEACSLIDLFDSRHLDITTELSLMSFITPVLFLL